MALVLAGGCAWGRPAVAAMTLGFAALGAAALASRSR